MSNKLVAFLLLFVLLFTILTIGSYSSTLGMFNDSENAQVFTIEQFRSDTHGLEYRILDAGESGTQTYEADFAQTDLALSTSEYSILINRLAGQSYQVYLNGTYLGGAGEFEGLNSNVWNSMYRFEFDDQLIKPENTLTIKIEALYDVGLTDFPIIIVDNQFANKIYTHYQISQLWLRAFSLGILLFCTLSMIIFLNYFKENNRRKAFFYFAVAASFSIVYFMDLFPIAFLPVDYLVFKKITILASYFTLASLSMCFGEYFGVKRVKYLAYATVVIALTGAFVINNMITYKAFYDKTAILLLINGLSWIYCAYSYDRGRQLKKMMMIAALVGVLLISPIVMNLAIGRDSGSFFSLAQLMIMMIALPILMLIINEVSLLQNTIEHEKERWKDLYENSIRDGLTGLYTYSFMLDHIGKTKAPYVIALIDADNLKQVNDLYGHVSGNTAIKLIARILSAGKQAGMQVGRFGGDEFIVCYGGPLDEMSTYAEKVREQIADQSAQEIGMQVTVSIGIYENLKDEPVEFVFDYADQSLYKAKKEGKNRVEIFNLMQ